MSLNKTAYEQILEINQRLECIVSELRVDVFNSLSKINQRTLRMEHLLTNLTNHLGYSPISYLAPSSVVSYQPPQSLHTNSEDHEEERKEDQIIPAEIKMPEAVQQIIHNMEPKVFHPSEALLVKYEDTGQVGEIQDIYAYLYPSLELCVGQTFNVILENVTMRKKFGKCLLACCVNLIDIASIIKQYGNQNTRWIMKSLTGRVEFIADTTKEVLKSANVSGIDRDQIITWIADKIRNQLDKYRNSLTSILSL
jgi:hypothetical protein